jgi:hypothetical protein
VKVYTALSARFSTVEGLLLSCTLECPDGERLLARGPTPSWREFFEHFHSVKTPRINARDCELSLAVTWGNRLISSTRTGRNRAAHEINVPSFTVKSTVWKCLPASAAGGSSYKGLLPVKWPNQQRVLPSMHPHHESKNGSGLRVGQYHLSSQERRGCW